MARSSIKYQFSLVIAALVVVLLTLNAGFLIWQKGNEMTRDMLDQTYNFSNLAADKIMTNYDENFLSAKSWTRFESRMNEIKNLNSDISGIQIDTYAGQEIYTTADRAENQEDRSVTISDSLTLTRLQQRNPSVLTLSGEVYYLKSNAETGSFDFVNQNEDQITAPSDNTRYQNLILPTSDNEHSLVFQISYDNLDEMIKQNIITIVALTLGGLLLAVLVAFFLAGRVTAPLISLTSYVKTLASGEERHKIKVKSTNEIGQLASSFNQMIDDLEKYEGELVDQERMQTELRLAASIQEDLIPKNIPQAQGLEIAANVHPAAEIGGDCYDFFKRENELLFYIGDVTGHGVPAGLVVSIANALFFYFAKTIDSTCELLAQTNAILKPKTKPNMFLTALACRWHEIEQKLFYTSAGHDQPIVYRKQEDKIEDLKAGGIALGMLPDITKLLKEETVLLSSGDVFVLYTDGIPEAWGPAEKPEEKHAFYEMPRFRESLKKHATSGKSAQEILDGILEDVHSFMADIPAQDDITIIVVKKQ